MNFLDARSESAGESHSRVVLDRIGMPAPVPQYEVWDHGVLVGRADFCWGEFRTLGEFDGKEKYGRLLKLGNVPRMPSSRRSVARMLCATLAGRSFVGSGKICITPEELRRRLLRAFERCLRAP
jgi:hypothetical protein